MSSTSSSPETTETTNSPAPTVAPEVVVDPGQVIRINARFPNAPETVLFSYLPPQSDVAVHDPGAGATASEIQNDDDLFHYSIDTRGMHGGVGWWYFVSEDSNPSKRRAKVGRFVVRDVPRALLERRASPLYFDNNSSNSDENNDGLSLLGADSEEHKLSRGTKVAIGAGVLIGIFLFS